MTVNSDGTAEIVIGGSDEEAVIAIHVEVDVTHTPLNDILIG